MRLGGIRENWKTKTASDTSLIQVKGGDDGAVDEEPPLAWRSRAAAIGRENGSPFLLSSKQQSEGGRPSSPTGGDRWNKAPPPRSLVVALG